MKNIWEKIIYLFTAIACLFSIGCKEEKDEKSKTSVKQEEMNEKNNLVITNEKELPGLRSKIYGQDIEKVNIFMTLVYENGEIDDDELVRYHKENQEKVLSENGLDIYDDYRIKQYYSNNVYYNIPYSNWNENIKSDFEKAKQKMKITYISKYNTIYASLPSSSNLEKVDYKELNVKENIKPGIYFTYDEYAKENQAFIDKNVFEDYNLVITKTLSVPYMNIKKEINEVYMNNNTLEICEKTYEPLVTMCAEKTYNYVLLVPKRYNIKDVKVNSIISFDKIKGIRDAYYKTYTLNEKR